MNQMTAFNKATTQFMEKLKADDPEEYEKLQASPRVYHQESMRMSSFGFKFSFLTFSPVCCSRMDDSQWFSKKQCNLLSDEWSTRGRIMSYERDTRDAKIDD